MSKRKAGAFSQSILCDDVILLIVNFMIGKPTIAYVNGRKKQDDMNALETYFALPLVNKAFNRLILTNEIDWKSMLEKRYKDRTTITQEIARIFVYHDSEKRRLNNLIDTIVLKEKVTYRSPVKKELSEGRLSHKKLRQAKYPSATVKNKVLDALRKYERLCKTSCSMRKKYLKMDYYS